MSFLKTIDYFSIPQVFKVNNKKKYGSSLGGFVFLFYAVVALSYTIFKSIPFIARQDLILVFNEQVVLPPPKLDFDELKFNFAFQLVHDNELISPEIAQYFSHSLEFIQYANSVPMEPTNIPLRECKDEDFDYITNGFETMDKVLHLRKYLCPSNLRMDIGGLLTAESYHTVSLKVQIKEEFINSASLASLKNKMRVTPIQSRIFFKDAYLDVNNLSTPISFFANNYTTSLSLENRKNVGLDYMYFSLVDDKNYFVPVSNENVYIKFMAGSADLTETTDRTLPNTANRADFVSYTFKSNPTIRKMERRYVKFPAFLAEVTVVLSNGILVLVIGMQFVNEFQMNRDIMNEILEFKHKLSSKTKEGVCEILGQNPNQSQFKASLVEIIPNSRNPVSNLKKPEKRIKKEPVMLSIWQCITTCNGNCRMLSKDQKAYKIGLNRLNQYFDIFAVIRMMQEFHVYKQVLFSQSEQKVMKFLSKPVLELEKVTLAEEGVMIDEVEIQKLKEELNRMDSAGKTAVSEQIKEMTDKKLKHLVH